MKDFENSLEFVESNQKCSYYDNEISKIRYRYIKECSSSEDESLVQRGWRRFGKLHFVPECEKCKKCVSMRIDVKNYIFSKSDKRVIAKNQKLNIYFRTPSITVEHLELYNKYHEIMHIKKEWPYSPITPKEYYNSYVDGSKDNNYAHEILFLDGDKLVCVTLIDILENSISAIYTFYDHDYKKLSLGKFSILTQIITAKKMGIPYIYLGYWIKDHYSMGYKINYQPFEILENRPTINDEPIWKKYEF